MGLQFLDDEAVCDGKRNISIIPAPFAGTVSWKAGTEKGPKAILDASAHLENFDDELLVETCRAGIETLSPLRLVDLSVSGALQVIAQAVTFELDRDRLPVLIGGEHTITLPAVAACARAYPDLHVVQFDAHLDLRETYDGEELSHACVMRRVHDLGIGFTQIGIRSFSRGEWDFVGKAGLTPFSMQRIRKEHDWMSQVLNEINGPVYLTFDVDAFDPAIVPATGTPEPDGLTWKEVTGMIRGIAAEKQIVGADFVEFSPVPGAHHAAFTVAKLIYRTLGYIFYKELNHG